MADGEARERRQEFRVDDRVYAVRPFKGSKGVRALAILSRVGDRADKVWEAVADFEERYRARTKLTITRDMARYRVVQQQNAIADVERRMEEVARDLPDGAAASEAQDRADALAALSAEAAARDRAKDEWQRMLDGPLVEQESIEVPQAPSGELKFLAVFPLLWEIAEPEMTSLVGLVLIPDDELRQARRDGRADEAVQELGEELLDALELDEVAELLLTAVETSTERYRAQVERLGNRWARLRGTLTRSRTAEAQDPQEEDDGYGPDRRRTEPIVGSVEVPPPSEKQTSSTGSPEPTDGTPTESSSRSSGPISSASAA